MFIISNLYGFIIPDFATVDFGIKVLHNDEIFIPSQFVFNRSAYIKRLTYEETKKTVDFGALCQPVVEICYDPIEKSKDLFPVTIVSLKTIKKRIREVRQNRLLHPRTCDVLIEPYREILRNQYREYPFPIVAQTANSQIHEFTNF